MEWIESITKAIDYIEENITQDLNIEKIAKNVFVSPFYFQKGFAMLCGITVGEYIRLRRLTLAGIELVSGDVKIIDVAVKYGYDSPDSFSKAFTRFHGVTPTSVKKDKTIIKSFARLKIKFTLEGGFIMDYKVVKKSAFTIVGVSKKFAYENAHTEVPEFWKEYFSCENKAVCGMYGINIDESMGNQEFEYLIADNYNPALDIPKGHITKTIPEFTWAVFPCKGPMPATITKVNKQIFSEWLPNCHDYEFAAGYNIEMYSDPTDFSNGIMDENYYCEIWIPVKKK